MKKIFLFGTALLTILSLVVSCHDKGPIIAPHKPTTFVLVHGAWQAPFVWDSIKPILEANGDKVITVELPGHGDDTTSAQTLSIDSYRDKVIAAINKVNGKVVLIGHSMGGVVVTAVAEAIPDRIGKLVYIGAFLPSNGQSLLDLAGTDAQSLLGPALIPVNGGVLLDINRDSVTQIFCEDGNSKQKALVLSKFKPEPGIPFGNKVSLTAEHFGTVEKYYIHTALDNAVGPDLQSRMAAAANIKNVYSLNTGHCPFITAPTETAKLFLQISAIR